MEHSPTPAPTPVFERVSTGQLPFHTPILPTPIFFFLVLFFCWFFFACTYFMELGCLLSHGACPKVGCRTKPRGMQDAGGCCYRAEHEVWLFFKEIPCSLHHSTFKTTHFTSVTGNDMNVAGGETLLFSLFQRT